MGKDYRILDLEKEYPGYTGTERWLIITDLEEAEFALKYPREHCLWEDAVIMSSRAGNELRRFKNNEMKHSRIRKNRRAWTDDRRCPVREEIEMYEKEFGKD